MSFFSRLSSLIFQTDDPEVVNPPHEEPSHEGAPKALPHADVLMLDFLREQGLQPHVEDDGDIVFKYQMLNFISFASRDEDTAYLHLAMPCIQPFDDELRPVILEATNKMNIQLKSAKFIVTANDVWISVETLIDSTPHLDDFVPRMLNLLVNARNEFYAELK